MPFIAPGLYSDLAFIKALKERATNGYKKKQDFLNTVYKKTNFIPKKRELLEKADPNKVRAQARKHLGTIFRTTAAVVAGGALASCEKTAQGKGKAAQEKGGTKTTQAKKSNVVTKKEELPILNIEDLTSQITRQVFNGFKNAGNLDLQSRALMEKMAVSLNEGGTFRINDAIKAKLNEIIFGAIEKLNLKSNQELFENYNLEIAFNPKEYFNFANAVISLCRKAQAAPPDNSKDFQKRIQEEIKSFLKLLDINKFKFIKKNKPEKISFLKIEFLNPLDMKLRSLANDKAREIFKRPEKALQRYRKDIKEWFDSICNRVLKQEKIVKREREKPANPEFLEQRRILDEVIKQRDFLILSKIEKDLPIHKAYENMLYKAEKNLAKNIFSELKKLPLDRQNALNSKNLFIYSKEIKATFIANKVEELYMATSAAINTYGLVNILDISKDEINDKRNLMIRAFKNFSEIYKNCKLNIIDKAPRSEGDIFIDTKRIWRAEYDSNKYEPLQEMKLESYTLNGDMIIFGLIPVDKKTKNNK